jgi:hypothetical protein
LAARIIGGLGNEPVQAVDDGEVCIDDDREILVLRAQSIRKKGKAALPQGLDRILADKRQRDIIQHGARGVRFDNSFRVLSFHGP